MYFVGMNLLINIIPIYNKLYVIIFSLLGLVYSIFIYDAMKVDSLMIINIGLFIR